MDKMLPIEEETLKVIKPNTSLWIRFLGNTEYLIFVKEVIPFWF